MLIVPEDDDSMDADADDEDDDYIPDAGGVVGTSNQVCGNGRQAGVPRARLVAGAGQVVEAGLWEGAGYGRSWGSCPRGKPDLEELWGP